MRRLLEAALLAAAIASCTWTTRGTIEPAARGALHSGFASGARLRARIFSANGGEAASGARSFLGWHDTALDAPCSFRVADDGALRCVPTAFLDASLFYIDAQCTQAAATAPTASCGEKAPRYVAVETAKSVAACDPPEDGVPVAVYALGAAVGDASAAYALDARGKCAPAKAPQATLFAASRVDPATFVAATVRVVTLSAELAARERAADDGSYETLRLVDVARNADCAPMWGFYGRDDDGPCVPVDLAWEPQRYFSDATCQTPAAYHDVACAKPAVGIEQHGDGCALTLTLFTPGDEITLGYSTEGSGKCHATLEPPEPFRHHYFTIGASIDPSTFPQVKTVRVGGGRLQASTHTATDGTPLLGAIGDAFYDSELHASCRVRPFADGVLRCVPDLPQADGAAVFGDAECTQQLVEMTGSACAPDPMQAIAQAITPDGCQTISTVYALAPWPGSVYTRDTAHGDACVSAPLAADARYYRVGAALDPAMFGSVSRVTE